MATWAWPASPALRGNSGTGMSRSVTASPLLQVLDVRDLVVRDERRVGPALRGFLGPDLDLAVGDHDRDDRAAALLALSAAGLRSRNAGRGRVPPARPADGGLVDVAAVGVDQRARGPGPLWSREDARLVHPIGIALGHCIRRSPRRRGCVAASLPRVQVKTVGAALASPNCDRLPRAGPVPAGIVRHMVNLLLCGHNPGRLPAGPGRYTRRRESLGPALPGSK